MKAEAGYICSSCAQEIERAQELKQDWDVVERVVLGDVAILRITCFSDEGSSETSILVIVDDPDEEFSCWSSSSC